MVCSKLVVAIIMVFKKKHEQIFSQGPIFVKYVALHCITDFFFTFVSGKVIASFLKPTSWYKSLGHDTD